MLPNDKIAYPVPAFHFSVKIGNAEGVFTEVSGLNLETEVIEYRHGMNKDYTPLKMPGLMQTSEITLKKGVFTDDLHLYKWFTSIKLNSVERKEVVISLLNEKHEPVMTWTVKNCWPKNVTSPELNASSNEIAIESVELVNEGVTVSLP